MNQSLRRPMIRALRTSLPLLLMITLIMSFIVSLSTASAATSPLTVTITNPTNNALVGNRTPLLLSSSVTDSITNATITRVEFYNNATLIGTVTTAPHNFSWLPLQPGTDTLTAEAYDSAGKTAVSAPITIQVFVQDPLPPATIKLTSPISGTVYTAPATIVLTASISQPSNPIVSVSFFNGTTLLGTSTSTPYSFTWRNVGAGTYSLTASYIDTFGITEMSAAVTVTVSPSLLPVITINAGGSATGKFLADTDFNQGHKYSDTSTPIDTSGVTNPAPQAVWQTCSWNASFTYTIPGLTAGTTYVVQLDWAELTWHAVGQRVFNVAINGTSVLSKFDVYAQVGYKKALAKQFNVVANSSGQVVISFTQGGADNPFISGIEIFLP